MKKLVLLLSTFCLACTSGQDASDGQGDLDVAAPPASGLVVSASSSTREQTGVFEWRVSEDQKAIVGVDQNGSAVSTLTSTIVADGDQKMVVMRFSSPGEGTIRITDGGEVLENALTQAETALLGAMAADLEEMEIPYICCCWGEYFRMLATCACTGLTGGRLQTCNSMCGTSTISYFDCWFGPE